MSVNPNQGQGSDQYGGYSGYTPPSQPNDPYNSQQYGQQSGYQQGGYQQQDAGYAYGQQQQQEQIQYNTYQPPLASKARTRGKQSSTFSSSSATSTGMAPNQAAFLSYLFWWISGLVFLVIERKNRFVRFSAAQSFAFMGSSFLVVSILHFLGGFFGAIPLIGFIFAFLFNIVTFVILVPVILIWIFLMFQAFRGVPVRLPFFGNIADNLANRFGGKDAV